MDIKVDPMHLPQVSISLQHPSWRSYITAFKDRGREGVGEEWRGQHSRQEGAHEIIRAKKREQEMSSERK